MSRKIIGVTVGTPMSTEKLKTKIRGIVDITISEVTDEDDNTGNDNNNTGGGTGGDTGGESGGNTGRDSYSVTFNGTVLWLSHGDVDGHFEVNGEEFDPSEYVDVDPDDWDDLGFPPVTIDGVKTLAIVGNRDFFVGYRLLESGDENALFLTDWGGRLEIPMTEDIEILYIDK